MASICTIYRSDTKSGLYLYLQQGTSMSDIPEDLIKLIGQYTQVMELDLDTVDNLALVDINIVKESLDKQGFFVQLPKKIMTNTVSFKP